MHDRMAFLLNLGASNLDSEGHFACMPTGYPKRPIVRRAAYDSVDEDGAAATAGALGRYDPSVAVQSSAEIGDCFTGRAQMERLRSNVLDALRLPRLRSGTGP